MATLSADYGEIVRKTLTGWSDWRLFSQDELEALIWYAVYIFDETLKSGGDWTGCSFSQRDQVVIMTSRRTYDGVPQVVFTTGRTTMGCILIFRKRWLDGTLEWVRDKYR